MFERIAPMVPSWVTRRSRLSPVQDQMRQDWDDRARRNALYYIVTDAAESEEQFAASGEQSVQTILADIQQDVHAEGTVLEIGCGVGRMLRPLAQRFAMVYGVDVSAEMISRARARLADLTNVSVSLTDGTSLRPIKSESVDVAISYLVFQHIPDASVVEGNIAETFRVLRPGGVFKFQVAGRPDTVDAEFAERSRSKDTWCGVNFSDSEIRRMCSRLGFTIRSTRSQQPEDSCYWLWVVVQKPRRR